MNLIALFSISMLIGLSKAQPAAWGVDEGDSETNTGLKIKVIIDGEPADTGFLGAMAPNGLFTTISNIAFNYDEHFIDDEAMSSGHYFQLQIWGIDGEVHTLYFSRDGVEELLLTPTYTFVSNDLRFLEFTYTTPVNCVGDFDEWTTCSGGTQSKTYSVTQEAAGTGTACPHPDGHTETQNCQGADGAACTQGSECVSGTCTNSLCAAAGASGIDMTWDLQVKWNLVSFNVKPADMDDALASIDIANLQGCTDTQCTNGGEYIILKDGKNVKFYDLGPDVAGGQGDKKWLSLTTPMSTFNPKFKDYIESGTAFRYYTPVARTDTINGPKFDSIDYDFQVGMNWVGIIGQDEISYNQNDLLDSVFLDNSDVNVGDSIIHKNGGTIQFFDQGAVQRKWYSPAGATFKLKPGEGFYYKRTGSALQFTKSN